MITLPSKLPFTREVSIDHRFKLPWMEKAAYDLKKIMEKKMIASLIAPAGAGKTVVLRHLRERLGDSLYRVSYLKVSDLSQRDLCREIAALVGAPPSGLFPALVRNIQDTVEKATASDGRRPVLIVDEAQDLRLKALSVIKLITNFDMDSKLAVGIVLAGQPALATILQHETTRDLAQRISHHVELPLLSPEECRLYIAHRCEIAGMLHLPFDDSSLASIFEITRGNMRAIDNLALKSIELAVERKIDRIDSALILAARRALWI